MVDFNLSEHLGALAAAVLTLVLGVQKIIGMWSKGAVDQSKSSAEKSVIDSLHIEFKRISTELEESRERQTEMNEMIRREAIKLTRMEILLLRMYNLLAHNNVPIPEDLKVSMDSFILPMNDQPGKQVSRSESP